MKRPLGLVALSYAGGLLAAEFLQPPLAALFLLSLALAVVALLFGKTRALLLWPLIFLTGWTNLVSRTAVVSPHDLRTALTDAPEEVAARGRLLETPGERLYVHDEIESSRTLARLTVTAIRRGTRWQSACGRIVVTTPGKLPAEFFAGRVVDMPPLRPADFISVVQLAVGQLLVDRV